MSIPQPKFGDDEEELNLDVKITSGNIKDRAKIKAIMDVKEIKEIDEVNDEKKKISTEKTHRKNLVYEFKLGEVSTLLYSENPDLLVKISKVSKRFFLIINFNFKNFIFLKFLNRFFLLILSVETKILSLRDL